MTAASPGQPGCNAAWKVQPGRSRLQRRVCSDGYVGEYPYAGVVVVAEGLDPDDDPSAEITVNTVRDVFAEGVAYGIEEALSDALREAADIIRRSGHGGCSAAAVAFCGTHAWFASTGACRVLKFDENTVSVLAADNSGAEASGMGREHPDYPRRVRELDRWLGGERDDIVTGHTRIRPGSVVLAATPGIWMHMKDGPSLKRTTGRNIEAWLTGMIRECRAAYRRQGGAAAAASCHSGGRSPVPVIPFLAVSIMVILGVMLAAGVFDSRSPGEDPQSFFAGSDSTPELVLPLSSDSASSRFWSYSRIRELVADSLGTIPDISASLPLRAVLAGGDPSGFSPDTFMLSINGNPSLQWENYSPGIYPLAGDTAAVFLAEALSGRYPGLPVVPLATMVTVREAGVSDAAQWLRDLNPVDASGVGVVVETRSSVAGGASWIRNYPVFVNGDRMNLELPGGFAGDSIPGMPFTRNGDCYRLLIVP